MNSHFRSVIRASCCFPGRSIRFLTPGSMAKVEDDVAVGSLTVKLPTFWPDKPEAWFVQAEANFRARRITSQKTQFNVVVVVLDADTIDGVLDLLEVPPDEESYDKLKACLVQSFKISKVEKLSGHLPPLTDENPIKVADKIMAWTRQASGEDFAKAVFMLKMPDGIRKTMWAEPLASWPEMKARASGLWHAEKTRSRATVFAAEAVNVCEPEANVVRAPVKGPRSSRFQEFAKTFKQ